MTNDYSHLKPGLRWARYKTQSTGYSHLWSRWVILRLEGEFPFMKASIAFDPKEDTEDPIYIDPNKPNLWQYGPKLEIPSGYWEEVEDKYGR